MANKTLVAAHLDEAERLSADITNLGHYQDDKEIESKTTADRLRTKLSDTGDIEHEWYQDNVQPRLAGYNNAPTANAAREWLEAHHLLDIFQIADGPDQDWKNDDATLVLKYKEWSGPLGFHHGAALAEFTAHFHADEFNTKHFNYITYVRIWWD